MSDRSVTPPITADLAARVTPGPGTIVHRKPLTVVVSSDADPDRIARGITGVVEQLIASGDLSFGPVAAGLQQFVVDHQPTGVAAVLDVAPDAIAFLFDQAVAIGDSTTHRASGRSGWTTVFVEGDSVSLVAGPGPERPVDPWSQLWAGTVAGQGVQVDLYRSSWTATDGGQPAADESNHVADVVDPVDQVPFAAMPVDEGPKVEDQVALEDESTEHESTGDEFAGNEFAGNESTDEGPAGADIAEATALDEGPGAEAEFAQDHLETDVSVLGQDPVEPAEHIEDGLPTEPTADHEAGDAAEDQVEDDHSAASVAGDNNEDADAPVADVVGLDEDGPAADAITTDDAADTDTESDSSDPESLDDPEPKAESETEPGEVDPAHDDEPAPSAENDPEPTAEDDAEPDDAEDGGDPETVIELEADPIDLSSSSMPTWSWPPPVPEPAIGGPVDSMANASAGTRSVGSAESTGLLDPKPAAPAVEPIAGPPPMPVDFPPPGQAATPGPPPAAEPNPAPQAAPSTPFDAPPPSQQDIISGPPPMPGPPPNGLEPTDLPPPPPGAQPIAGPPPMPGATARRADADESD